MTDSIKIKTDEEIELMAESGRILATIMDELWKEVKVGTDTYALDEYAQELCKSHRVRPAFLGYEVSGLKFPAATCACINEEIVHGVPKKGKTVKEGDIFTLDMGVDYKGWMSDMAVTHVVGEGSDVAKKIVKASEETLAAAINECRVGNRLKDISDAIMSTATKHGARPMIELVGHGIGQDVHEEPPVPGHWIEEAYNNITLEKNMVLAIEAILTSGESIEIEVSKEDKWTTWPKDKALTSCSENTVVIDSEPRILTKT